MGGGRPIRFLALVIGGWTTLRALALLPAADPIAVAEALIGAKPAAAATPRVVPRRPLVSVVSSARRAATVIANSPPAKRPILHPPTAILVARAIDVPRGRIDVPPPRLVVPLDPAPPLRTASRFAGSAWLIARGAGGGDPLSSSQLGASQAGARLTYALGRDRRVALSARIAAPLEGRGAEAGIGIDWQPTRAPVHLLIEQRIALDGGRGGPAALVVGGIGPITPIPGLRVEAYGQAGAIHRGRIETFADGAARVAHPIATLHRLRFDIGAGAWGGAQRGAARLDIGPTIGASVPVAGKALRLTLDWRQRVAGRARPGSGPALSLGTDF